MNHPALKREVSINKMLKLKNPGLRRSNVVSNSFSGSVADASKEFSRTPEMAFSEIISEPGMLLHQAESTVTFEQLQGFANTHSWGQLNKQVDMVNSDVKLIDFTALPVSNLPNKELTIHPKSIELKGIPCIFNFPHEVEGILSEAMLPRFQIHFLSPKHSHDYVQHLFSGGLVSRPSYFSHLKELNFEDGDSSPSLKTWVSSPLM